MQIIKLFRVNIFVCSKVFSLDNLVIFQKEAILDLWSVQGAFQRNQRQKNGDIALTKKAREKTRMAKRAQRSVTKKRELIFEFSIFKYE